MDKDKVYTIPEGLLTGIPFMDVQVAAAWMVLSRFGASCHLEGAFLTQLFEDRSWDAGPETIEEFYGAVRAVVYEIPHTDRYKEHFQEYCTICETAFEMPETCNCYMPCTCGEGEEESHRNHSFPCLYDPYWAEFHVDAPKVPWQLEDWVRIRQEYPELATFKEIGEDALKGEFFRYTPDGIERDFYVHWSHMA